MTARNDRLNELLGRMREACEVGSPLIVQQRLLSDFSACLQLRGVPTPRVQVPLNHELLTTLELSFSPDNLDLYALRQ